jgi:ABC-type lipoprotein export system ATPase subunit
MGFLVLEKIKKSFFYLNKKIEILKGVDLSVEKGEKIAIVGPSGVGKTTLLHIIGTIERPDSGRLFFERRDLTTLSEKGLAEVRKSCMGFVFQMHYLLPELNVLENVMLPGKIAGLSEKEAKERAKRLLELFGLGERFFYKPSHLSGGERQRVAIARALLLNPPLLLADEPTGNLDPQTAEEVIQAFLKANEEAGTTLILVTHNLDFAKNG